MKWEAVPFNTHELSHCLYRAKIFGGWLVLKNHVRGSYNTLHGESLIFVPDAKHEWKLENYYD